MIRSTSDFGAPFYSCGECQNDPISEYMYPGIFRGNNNYHETSYSG